MELDFTPILDAVQVMLKETMEGLSFNRKIEGVITEVLNDGKYRVRVQNKEDVVKTIDETTYLIGDVVLIIVFNNDYSDKRIIGKR